MVVGARPVVKSYGSSEMGRPGVLAFD